MNDTRVSGPYVIGAIGGSGTRVVAAIVRQGGMYIGTRVNRPLDSLVFAEYCARWIPSFAGNETRPSSAAVVTEMKRQLNEVVERHLAPISDANHAWGWKNSGSLLLLPFLHSQFPALKFLHIVRDGRDMAYASNQYQVRRHGHLVLTPDEQRWSQPLRSIALWARLNLVVAEYAAKHLGDRYLLVRFEDLCASPVSTVRRILDFCELKADATHIARDQVVPPRSIGRWRNQHPKTVAKLCEVAGVALQRFGYSDGSGTEPAKLTARDRAVAFGQALRSRLSAGLGGHVAEGHRLLRQEVRRRMRRHPRT